MTEKKNKFIRYHEWGDRENPTIICLHGLGSSSMSFIELGELLKDKYRIVSIDLPGHSDSHNIYNLDMLMRHLRESINAITNDSYYLLGHSLGGWVALHYAAMYPEVVNGVILPDGGYHQTKTIHEYYLSLDKTTLEYKPSTSIEEELNSCDKFYTENRFSSIEDYLSSEKNAHLRWNENLKKASLDTVIEDHGIVRFKINVDALKSYVKMMYNYPTADIYKTINKPMLLLQSNNNVSWHWNTIRNVLGERFQKMTNAKIIKVEASHNIHWDVPIEVAKFIIEWVERKDK